MQEEIQFDCEKLSGRLKSICDGASGLPEATRQAYIRRWAGMPPEPPVPIPTCDDFPCVHRGDQVGEISCKCGVERMLPVYACSIHGECTIGSPGAVTGKRPWTCISCNDLASPSESP